jgi:hypothetical protein
MPDLFGDRDAAQVLTTSEAELESLFEGWRNLNDEWIGELDPEEYGEADILSGRSDALLSPEQRRKRLESQIRSNWIPTGHVQLLARFMRGKPQAEVALLNAPSLTKKDLAKQSATERFLEGNINTLDAQAISRGETSWFERVVDFALCPGKLVGFVHVRSAAEGFIEVTWEVLDPAGVIHDFGNDGMQRFIIQTSMSPVQFRSMWNEDLSDKTSEFIERMAPGEIEQDFINDLWTRTDSIKISDLWIERREIDEDGNSKQVVYNGKLANGRVLFLRRMRFTRLNIYQLSGNGRKQIFSRLSKRSQPEQAFVRQHARPWFYHAISPNRGLNVTKTIEMEGIEKALRPTLVTTGQEGKFRVQFDGSGAQEQINLDAGQFVDYLKASTEALVAQSTIIEDLKDDRRAVLPDAMRGIIPSPQTSGFLMDQITDMSENMINGTDALIRAFLDRGSEEILHQVEQLKESGAKIKIRLAGMDQREGARQGLYFYEDFSVGDISTAAKPHWRTALSLPKDAMRAAQIFGIVTREGMLDKRTARAKIGGVRDPIAMEDAIQLDKIADSQPALAIATWQKMSEEVELLEDQAARSRDPSRKLRLKKKAMIAAKLLGAMEGQLIGKTNGSQQSPVPGNPPSEVQPAQLRGAESPQQASPDARGLGI